MWKARLSTAPINPAIHIKKKQKISPPTSTQEKQGPTGKVFSIMGGFRSGSEQKSWVAGRFGLTRNRNIRSGISDIKGKTRYFR